MNPDHMLDKERRDIWRRHGFGGRNEVCVFGEAIDDHEDCVVVVAWRQVRDPVRGHVAPKFIRDREGVQETVGRVAHHLVSLARITTAHVALDSCSEPRPLEVLLHECLRPRHSVVPR